MFHTYLNNFVDPINLNVHFSIINKTNDSSEVNILNIFQNHHRMFARIAFENSLKPKKMFILIPLIY